MNVRMNRRNIRFRVSSDEFQTLLGGESLVEKVPLPINPFHFHVKLDSGTSEMVLKRDGTDLVLTIDRGRLVSFAKNLPCREGITVRADTPGADPLEVSFEVDRYS